MENDLPPSATPSGILQKILFVRRVIIDLAVIVAVFTKLNNVQYLGMASSPVTANKFLNRMPRGGVWQSPQKIFTEVGAGKG